MPKRENIFDGSFHYKYICRFYFLSFCFVVSCDIYITRFHICRSNKTAPRSYRLFGKHWKISKQNFTSKQTSGRTKQRRILFGNSFVVLFVAQFMVVTVSAFVMIVQISNIFSMYTRYSRFNFNDPSIVPDFRVDVEHCSLFNVQCSMFYLSAEIWLLFFFLCVFINFHHTFGNRQCDVNVLSLVFIVIIILVLKWIIVC